MEKLHQTLEVEFDYFSKYLDSRCFELSYQCLSMLFQRIFDFLLYLSWYGTI